MSEIISRFECSTVLFKVDFCDDIGNTLKINATAFWVRRQNGNYIGDYILVTNKHNLVPGLKASKYNKFKIKSIDVQIRSIDGNKQLIASGEKINGLMHTSADIAIINTSSFSDFNFENGKVYAIDINEIATSSFISQNVGITDTVFFLGFPMNWYDSQTKKPIARQANMACSTNVPYSNGAIKTSDILLVSGLSFAGSSGSVVIFSKGIEGIRIDPYSGLSYFTKTSALHEISGKFEEIQKMIDVWEYFPM